MTRKMVCSVLFLCLVLSLSACSQRKAEAGLDYSGTSEKFMNALFSARFADAKAMALPGFADKVDSDVDTFAALLEKYDFQERRIVSARPWGQTGNPEGDLTVEIGYQYRAKGTEDGWSVGLLHLRVLNEEGRWGIAGVKYILPK